MAYHVLVARGDAVSAVEEALARLAGRGVDRAGAGLHKAMYVTRADQTVVMVASPEAPLAGELRDTAGWTEPEDPAAA